jgi:hypothetical protein
MGDEVLGGRGVELGHRGKHLRDHRNHSVKLNNRSIPNTRTGELNLI